MSETSLFTEDILAAARAKAQSIIGEAQTELQRATDEAKTSISKEASDIIRNAQAEAEAVKRRQISEARHLSKLHEQREKNGILTEVLERTKKRIIEATKDQAIYLPYITGQIANGIRDLGYDTAVIHVNVTDLKEINRSTVERDASAHLNKPIKVEWANDPIETIGGAIVSSTDGKTRIVNTIDQKFEALEPALLIEAGKSLFGKELSGT
jgi:vacuolar-type H+-ATPase subunit E/Vma4